MHEVASGTRETATTGFNQLTILHSEQTTFGSDSLSPDLALVIILNGCHVTSATVLSPERTYSTPLGMPDVDAP